MGHRMDGDHMTLLMDGPRDGSTWMCSVISSVNERPASVEKSQLPPSHYALTGLCSVYSGF